jgi:hypothetical protein
MASDTYAGSHAPGDRDSDGTGVPSRRDFLRRSGLVAAVGAGALGAGALGAGGFMPQLARAATSGKISPDALATIAQEAVYFGGPAVIMEYIWSENLDLGFKVNRLYPGRELATPQTLGIGPNVDTLYGFAWLDLGKEPQVIQVPAIPDRYYSFQLIDMWSNPFAYIGTRATGTGAGAYALTPPGWQGTLPSGVQSIAATTDRVFVLTRTLVNNPSDLAAAVAVEASYQNGPLSAYPDGLSAPIFDNLQSDALPPNLASYGIALFQQINEAILSYPPLPRNAVQAAKLRPVGVDVANYKPPSQSLAAILSSSIQPAVTAAQAYQASRAIVVNGWRVTLGITDITYNPLRRFALIIEGPGTHIEKEALYYGASSFNGAPLTGNNSYEIVFPSGQLPPVSAFWSLILYNSSYQLYANPIDRYEVASHTPDLIYRPDGSLSITVTNVQPTDPTTNWLPAPTDDFFLTLRTYIPQAPILNQTWQPPALQLSPS